MDKFWKCVSCSFVKETKDQTEEFLEVFDSVLAELSSIEELPLIFEISSWADQMVEKIQSCKFGLKFLKMFLWSLYILDDSDVEIKKILFSVNYTCETIWGISRKKLVEPPIFTNARFEYTFWILDLQRRIQHCKQKFEESCELLLQCSLRRDSFKKKPSHEFLDAIFENMRDLYMFKTDDEFVLIKNQIATLEKNLKLLHILLFLIPENLSDFEEVEEFRVVVHAFTQHSTSLIFLYWVKEVDEEMAAKLNLVLNNVKIKPCGPAFKAFYLRFLKEMKLTRFDSLLLGQIVQIFIDLLLENLVNILNDDFQILEEGMMFVIAFLANPPNQLAGDEELMMVTAEIEGLIKEDLYVVISVDDINEEGNFVQASTFLSDVIMKVQLVKGKVQKVYDQIRDSFSYDFPKINGLGFFDCLLQNIGFLKEKLKRDLYFIPFAKHLIFKIEEELLSLRPYLDDLFEQQKYEKELNDTWFKVIKLAYQTEYAINSCSVIIHPLWYNMAHLMEILDEIKVVNSELKKIEGRTTCSEVTLNTVLEDHWASGFNTMIVGLEKEIDIIVENLIDGSMSLDIVSIVGMAGLGKTTLANKVYNDPMVRHHFYMFSYCIVSQVHNVRGILLNILCDIKGMDDKMYDMVEEDLAEMLRKCLKGQRYLIIMDDIWDVKAWDEVKRSLPNDQNGSRVIFTTRIHNVALQAKKDCIIHQLRFLTDKESWDLLRKKAFRAEGCPLDFIEVGKMIAKNCKGLPLTIVLIAGLLAKSERSLSLWNKISETIGSYASMNGCMEVLELSYQHLPEHLKACFLYFGAFAEDTLIRVNKLTLLWIVEGFVQNANMENLENVAKEYLCDLVDRSLVIANERSSYGGIKSCRIHDLVHEFCQGKAQEENFLQYMDGYEASNSSSSIVCNAYRVCIHTKWSHLNDATKVCPNVHSLLDSRKQGTRYHYDFPNVCNLKLAQVMDLEEFIWTTSFIREIASSIHLRFIATSFPFESRIRLPSSISNLWNLEILILTRSRGSSELELPETIWNMTRLRHVNVGRCYLSNLGVKKRETYPQMVNLVSFSSPYISSTKDLKDLLQMSPSLRKLSFHYDSLKHQQYDFHFPNMASLCKLESLKVFNVREPCLSSFNFLSTLKKLSLSNCCIQWRYLPTINKMPCLEVLKLLDNAFVGHEWDMEDTDFPKLKFLKLQFLDLKKWIAYNESFPSLEILIVNNCYGLNTLPPCFGEILTLKRIQVYESNKVADSVVDILKAQKDFCNEELEVIVSRNPFLE